MVLSSVHKTKLSKTTAEKALLHNIAALERSVLAESDMQAKDALLMQLLSLRSQLSSAVSEGAKNGPTDKGHDNSALIKLYQLMLTRHADMINSKEEKTVGEIKALISKEDLTVSSLAEKFKAEGYAFASGYIAAAQNAFDYVKNEIKFVDADLNISFWLLPKEVVAEKIGDDEDIAVFLCSLLYALGDENAHVVIAELSDATSRAFVITEFDGKFMLLDPVMGHDFFSLSGEKKSVLALYSYNGAKIEKFLYKFNSKNYEQFSE